MCVHTVHTDSKRMRIKINVKGAFVCLIACLVSHKCFCCCCYCCWLSMDWPKQSLDVAKIKIQIHGIHKHTHRISPELTSILHHSFASAVNRINHTLYRTFIVWIFINYEKACQNISDLKNILSLHDDSWTELRYWRETRNCLACNFIFWISSLCVCRKSFSMWCV